MNSTLPLLIAATKEKRGLIIPYIRVSTKEQHIDRQLIAIRDITDETPIIDHASGKNANRDGYKLLLAKIRAGDLVIVADPDRIARDTFIYYSFIEELRRKKVSVYFTETNTCLVYNEDIDDFTDTDGGRLLIDIKAVIAASFLRSMKERQKIGITAAKAKGKFSTLGDGTPKDEAIFTPAHKRYMKNQIALGAKAYELYKDPKLPPAGKTTYYRWYRALKAELA